VCTFGIGKDKSQKVSNVDDWWLHLKQVTLLCNWPPNISNDLINENSILLILKNK